MVLSGDAVFAHFFNQRGPADVQSISGASHNCICIIQCLFDETAFETSQVVLEVHSVDGEAHRLWLIC